MLNNPFAKVFKDAFYRDVLDNAVYIPVTTKTHAERVKTFMNALNRFLHTSGQTPILYHRYAFDEHKLFEYALFLRGYMRDSQNVLASLEQKFAADPQLIDLFQASSEYVVACNHQLKDKRIFDNNVDYHFWKIDLKNGLQYAHYQEQNPQTERRNLFLFMPFRIKSDENTLSKWMYTNMKKTLDNKQVFAQNVDSFVVYYPIEKSRPSNITSLLKTIHDSAHYCEKQDLNFVQKHWLNFIAGDIMLDKNGKVSSAQPYNKVQLFRNCQNISIFSYCAGTANAHRCLNAFYDIGQQIYEPSVMQEAMHRILLISYGYLPVQEHSLYSGVHFYSNAIMDEQKREPFVNLNNHTLYEKTKCVNESDSARYSVMPDNRNYVVALKLNQPLTMVENEQFINLTDGEFGHNMANINTPNIHNTYPHEIFKSVLENGCKGVRGKNIFNMNKSHHQTENLALLSHLQQIR